MTRTSADGAPGTWMDGLPERELYDIYRETIESRFPAFGVRDFEGARFDMAQTLHVYDDTGRIDQALVDVIVTRESHQRFTDALAAFARKHGLQGWLESGESLMFVTDHGQFTDVPVVAETLGRLELVDRRRTVQVVSEMISLLRLDLGAGDFAVIDTLRNICNVIQTVPRLDGAPTADLRGYRERRNQTGLSVLAEARDTEGSTTIASLVARHNVASKNGSTLFIHEPNRRTLESYVDESVKVIPVCIDCPTFGPDGTVAPADMRFELFAPMQLTDARRDTRTIVEMFRDATNRMVGDRYPNGVKIRSWRAQMAAHAVKSLSSGRGSSDDGDEPVLTDD